MSTTSGVAPRRRTPRPRSRVARLLRWLLWAVVALLVAMPVGALALVLYALEGEPAVIDGYTVGARDAQRTRAMAKRMIASLLRPAEQAAISATEDDLNAVFAFAARSLPHARSRVNVTPIGLAGAVSIRVPDNPLGRYVNLRFGLAPSVHEVVVTQAELGRVAIPGDWALAMARLAADLVLGDRVGTRLVEGVRAVEFTGDGVRVSFTPVRELRENLHQIVDRMRDVRDELSPLGDPEVVRAYYARLLEIDDGRNGAAPQSLAAYIGPLVALARERAADRDLAAEHQAMILALAMHFGDTRFFERLVGKVRSGDLAGRPTNNGGARLAGRRDLMLHFVISAGLKIVADRGITYAIGEFKELLDSAGGGTGFSFSDLAADRAGIEFALAAIDPQRARRLQQALAGTAEEAAFFPAIAGLPDGLTDAEFKARYGSVEDPRYQAAVRDIDARIARCAAYL